MVEPLTSALPVDLRDEAEATGLRLAACVRHVIGIVVGADPTAHDVSFALNLDGVIAKRLVRMIRPTMTGTDALTKAPSASNLRVFMERSAVGGKLTPVDLDALRDAIQRYEALIRRSGPSKGALTTFLRHPGDASGIVPGRRLELALAPDGSIRPVDDPHATQWAHWHDLNFLAPDADLDALLSIDAPRIITWSGHPGHDLFERSPAAWSPESFERLCALCAQLSPRVRAVNRTLLLRPHARHVLCDAARCVSFMRDHARPAGWPIALAFDPGALIEDDMRAAASDHLVRTLEALGGLSACIIVPENAPDVLRVVESLVPTSTPIITMRSRS